MTITVQSVHFDADKKLIDFVNEKVEKLSHFYDNLIGAEVILRLDKSSTSDNKIAEIRLIIPGNDLFAKRQCKTFEEATDSSISALKTQLKKRKDKIRQV